MADNRERTFYFDLLRLIAILGVIIIHESAECWYDLDVNSTAWAVTNVYHSLGRWAVPVFVMISGALFLDPLRRVDTKKLYSGNILRIVTAFVFWTVFYAAVRLRGSGSSLMDYIRTAVYGHYHMWFLYMIVGLYIVVPILRCVTRSEKATEYYLAVALVFTFIIPWLMKLPVLSGYQGAYEKMSFFLTLGYTGYFVAGYYLSVKELNKKQRAVLYILGIVGQIAGIVLTWSDSVRLGHASDTYNDYLTLAVLAQSVAVFVLGKYALSRIRLSERGEKLVLALSRDCFGVYLVHPFFITEASKYLVGDLLLRSPLLWIPVTSLGVAVVSLAVSALLNRIPLMKDYFV